MSKEFSNTNPNYQSLAEIRKEAYEQGRAWERKKNMSTLKMLINGDYNSKEYKLLYSDFCEFLEEQDNDN